MINQIDWLRVSSFVAAIVFCWIAAGYLKLALGVRTGYTRKINHALTLVLGALWFLPLPLDEARASYRLAGAMLFGLLLLACCFPRAGLLKFVFQGYAREKDAPHEAFHVWFSWAVSLLGILSVDVLFDSRLVLTMAVLLLGIGDAVGEPIGIRFGKHRYAVRSVLSGETSTRTLEGTGAVVLGSFAAALVGLMFLGGFSNPIPVVAAAGGLAVLIATAEAYTPHGLDNFTIPLVAGVAMHLFQSVSLRG